MKALPLLALSLFLPLAPLKADESKPAAAAGVTMDKAKDVSIDEAAKLLKDNPKIVVLDVRTPEEFAKGHIAGAKNVDFNADDFDKQIEKLDPNSTYLVHCAAGGRSKQSLATFTDKKFKGVYHMNEGFKAWEKAGKPVEK